MPSSTRVLLHKLSQGVVLGSPREKTCGIKAKVISRGKEQRRWGREDGGVPILSLPSSTPQCCVPLLIKQSTNWAVSLEIIAPVLLFTVCLGADLTRMPTTGLIIERFLPQLNFLTVLFAWTSDLKEFEHQFQKVRSAAEDLNLNDKNPWL